jgi:hypothetical protein
VAVSVLLQGTIQQSVCCGEPCGVCTIIAEAPHEAARLWKAMQSVDSSRIKDLGTREAAVISSEAGWLAGFLVGMVTARNGGIHMHICEDHAEILQACVAECGGTMTIRTHAPPVKH